MVAAPSPLVQAAKKWPTAPALMAPDRTLDYAAFEDQLRRTVSALTHHGVNSNFRLALKLPNSPEYAITLFALFRLGAVACPVSLRWPPEYLQPYLEKIQAKGIVVEETENLDLGKTKIIRMDEIFPRKEWPLAKTDASLWLDKPATILSTSGSTAEPKAVLHSLGNHYYNALASNQNLPFGPGDRWLLSLPLYHVGGLAILFRAILGGGTVVIPEPGERLIDSIERYQITHLSVVTAQVQRLLDESKGPARLSSLKTILWGGGPIPSALLKRTLALPLKVYPTYGMTETASQAATLSSHDPDDRITTCGKQLKFNELRISHNEEVEVRGKTLFMGYVEPEGLTLNIDPEGWFKTGDLGSIDGNGYLTISGRQDNQFISGGENIHPEPIESLLRGFPGVLEAVVVPVPHREFGQRPAAFIKNDGGPLPIKELRSYLADALPKFMVPDHFFDWPPNIPLGDSKPPRALLRNLALAFTARFV